eukprot:scaffold57289_cov51-Attheya_sp.AAC.5
MQNDWTRIVTLHTTAYLKTGAWSIQPALYNLAEDDVELLAGLKAGVPKPAAAGAAPKSPPAAGAAAGTAPKSPPAAGAAAGAPNSPPGAGAGAAGAPNNPPVAGAGAAGAPNNPPPTAGAGAPAGVAVAAVVMEAGRAAT